MNSLSCTTTMPLHPPPGAWDAARASIKAELGRKLMDLDGTVVFRVIWDTYYTQGFTDSDHGATISASICSPASAFDLGCRYVKLVGIVELIRVREHLTEVVLPVLARRPETNQERNRRLATSYRRNPMRTPRKRRAQLQKTFGKVRPWRAGI